jgi:hypothetical protein
MCLFGSQNDASGLIEKQIDGPPFGVVEIEIAGCVAMTDVVPPAKPRSTCLNAVRARIAAIVRMERRFACN